MKLDNFFERFPKYVSQKGEKSPFLFLYSNSELFHAQLESQLQNIIVELWADRESIYRLSESPENLKTSEVKTFISQWDVKARFGVQIFCIENIARMTPGAQNACLKFFEEPGEGNIIILTAPSEAWVLETILSRVQVHDMRELHAGNTRNTAFYRGMIENHIQKVSDELVRYFFAGKYEKEEYIDFLYGLVEYIQKKQTMTHLLDEIHEDIWGILKNNLQAKYVVDKYIMKLCV